MLNIALNIAVTWVALADMFLVTSIAMEIIAFITRPDYPRQHRESPSKLFPMKFLIGWIILWPIAAYGIITAMAKGQTFTEYLDEQAKREDEVQTKAKKVIEDARKAVALCPVEWHEFSTPHMKIMLLVRDLSGVKTPTHMIYVPNDPNKHIVCIHAMPEPTDSVPFRFLVNQSENILDAMKLCIEDVDWAHLCVPGLESARRKSWRQQLVKTHRRKHELRL